MKNLLMQPNYNMSKNKKIKTLALSILLSLPLLSFSQDWTYFISSRDGNKYYYKNHSEDILNKKIWIKEVGNKLQRTSKNGKKINFSGYSLMLYNVNCREKSSALIKISYYSSNGTFLNSAEGNEYDFSYPNPGTIGESIIEAACDQ